MILVKKNFQWFLYIARRILDKIHFNLIIDSNIIRWSEYDELCHDQGEGAIDNLEDCNDAISFVNETYGNWVTITKAIVVNKYDRPRGCSIWYETWWYDCVTNCVRSLYFNQHKTGKKNANSRQLCDRGKNSIISNQKVLAIVLYDYTTYHS